MGSERRMFFVEVAVLVLIVIEVVMGLVHCGEVHCRRHDQPLGPAELFRRVFALLDEMERAQTAKVVALARRLMPGLTAEDIRNPHDFPDLDDPDWHFEDGQLAGIQSVRFAIRGLARELVADGRSERRRRRRRRPLRRRSRLSRSSGRSPS